MRKFIKLTLAVSISLLTWAPSWANDPSDSFLQSIIRAEDTRDSSLLHEFHQESDSAKLSRVLIAHGRIGKPSSADFILENLSHDHPSVRADAAFALGLLSHQFNLGAFGWKADEAWMEALIPLLNDEDETVVRSAAEALGKMGLEEAADTLGELLVSTQELQPAVAFEALRALFRLNADEVLAEFTSLGYNDNLELRALFLNVAARQRLSEAADAVIANLTHQSSQVRALAVRAAGRLILVNAQDILMDLMEDPDFHVRVEAIRALGSIGSDEAFAAITQRFQYLAELPAVTDRDTTLWSGEIENELVTLINELAELDESEENLALLSQLRARLDPIGYTAQVAYAKILHRLELEDKFIEFPEGFSTRTDEALAALINSWAELTTETAKVEVIRLLEATDAPENLQKRLKKLRPTLLSALHRHWIDAPDGRSNIRLIFDNEMRKTDDPHVLSRIAQLLMKDGEIFQAFDDLRLYHYILREDISETGDPRRIAAEKMGQFDLPRAKEYLRRYLEDPNRNVRKAIVGSLNIEELEEAESIIGTRTSSWQHLAGETFSSEDEFYAALAALAQSDVKAEIIMESGVSLEIILHAADAPINVFNFVQLAESGFFDGLTFHRVVPNFVVQGGDPRNDMEGGPDYTIPCEINRHRFQLGSVGMALSGKDTGGSQFFICHSPQPHLDGGYTLFGQVVLAGDTREILDNIRLYDTIQSVRIHRDR